MTPEEFEIERMLRQVFEQAAAALDERLRLGEIIHAAPDGRTTYARQDGDHAVLTVRKGDRTELECRVADVDWAALR